MKMKNRLLPVLLIFILIFSLALNGCDSPSTTTSVMQTETGEKQQQASGQSYQNITPETLKQMMETDKNLIIVDVREEAEYVDGHIAGSQLVPMSEFQSRVSEIPKDKKVALVCQSGSRSSMATEYLVQLGYNQVYNLDGGMMTWPYEVSKSDE